MKNNKKKTIKKIYAILSLQRPTDRESKRKRERARGNQHSQLKQKIIKQQK